MHLILGGRHMGKLAYAQSFYGALSLKDLEREPPEAVTEGDGALNLQAAVRHLLQRGEEVQAFFAARLAALRGHVLIGDEIGAGVVPLDPFERRWRDETGLLYQALAQEADAVDRVWAGLPMRLKG